MGNIRHVPFKSSPSYIIVTPRTNEAEPAWKSKRIGLYRYEKTFDPRNDKKRGEYSIEWSALRREGRGKTGKLRGFGWGFTFKFNDGDDLSLSLYFGRFLSVWFHGTFKRIAKWLSVSKEESPKYYWEERQTGIIFGWAGSFVSVWWNACVGGGGEGYPGIDWTSWRFRHWLLGRTNTDKRVLESGQIDIKLPEGRYLGNWKHEQFMTTHTKRIGKLVDLVRRPKWRDSWWMDIPGGIPVEGKGENSWDCGMDGIFGSGGDVNTPEELARKVAVGVRKDRERYGGPHNLPRAMSVMEAENWQKFKDEAERPISDA